MRPRALIIGGAVVVTVLALLAVLNRRDDTKRDAYEARARAVVDSARIRMTQAELKTRVAENLMAAADSAVRDADARLANVRERVVYVRQALPPAPDTCAPFIAARDSVIDDAVAAAETYRDAYKIEKMANRELRSANDLLRTSADSLMAVLQARPKPRSRLIPTVTVGPYVGVETSLRPSTGVGVMLGWKIF